MHRISKLTVKNFKFFYEEVSIDFNRKSVLLYGENGSGKSSIYWALYTFFQSAFKKPNEILKYFENRSDENLRNVYSIDESESAISIEFDDGVLRTISNKQITTKTTKDDNLLLEATLGSDFIDYKVLSRIFLYHHKDEINLFDFFNVQLFSFINFREELIKPGEATGSKNAETWWQYISTGLSPQPKMHEQVYKDFQQVVNRFNIELGYYLNVIEETTNNFLKERFEEKFKIKFEYRNGTYNDFKTGTKGRSWRIKTPQIILSVELTTELIEDANKRIVESPQMFLNEAKLSALALAMRFAILDEKFVNAYPKILVLDDVLMSMDMSNREFVLNMMLENYLKDYQIIFFTHQRGLFEDARKFIQLYHAKEIRISGEKNQTKIDNNWKEHWTVYEMYETENRDSIPIPKIQLYKSSLQKAFYYLKEEIDYNACGNNLRTYLEEFFRQFIPYNFFRDKHGNPIDGKKLMLDALLKKARDYFDYAGFHTGVIDKLERYKERALNPASHFNPRANFFKIELKDIFKIIDELLSNKNYPLLPKDNVLQFEIKTEGGKSYRYTAILLDDICLYKKKNENSFFLDKDKRGYIFKSCLCDGVLTEYDNIVKGTLTEIYDKMVAYINKTDVAIVEPNMYNIFGDEIGKNLEELKTY